MTKAKPSKSAKKREYLALQELGENLLELTPEQITSIGIDDALLAAILDAKSIKSHGALRRQRQLIGKLMRHVDPQPIRQALDDFGCHDRAEKAIFRRAEAWRDRIADEGAAALPAFYAEAGRPDDELASIVAELQAATQEPRIRQIRRRLFRAVYTQLAGRMHCSAD